MERQVSAHGDNLPFAHLLASLTPWQGFLWAAGQNLPRGQRGLAQAGLLHTSAPPAPASEGGGSFGKGGSVTSATSSSMHRRWGAGGRRP